MTKDTFKIERDSKGLCYIFQAKDESDQNHNETDTDESNQAKIYEIPGMTFIMQIYLKNADNKITSNFFQIALNNTNITNQMMQNQFFLTFRITNLSSQNIHLVPE